jgi:hypothetical protein
MKVWLAARSGVDALTVLSDPDQMGSDTGLEPVTSAWMKARLI